MSPTATVPVILCRADEYHSAGEVFGGIVTEAVSVHEGLIGVLSANAGMAGSDSVGGKWAASYDEAAGLAMSTSARLTTASGQTRDLISVGLHNLQTGESAANFNSVPPPAAPQMLPVPCLVETPASAAGDGIPEPFGWSIIKDLVGAAWPNGHQDELHTAEAAWNTAASDFRTLAIGVPEAVGFLSNQQSDEIPAAIDACTQRQNDLNSLADACQSLGQACGEYAHHLDEAHHQILDELKEFAAEAVVGELAFAALAPFTAGISEWVGNTALGARVAMKARRVAAIIANLATKAAEIVSRTVKPLSNALKPLLERISTWVDAARTKLATIGQGTGKVLPATLTQADEDAIAAYTNPYTGLYEELNSALRAGSVDATQKAQIKAVEEALAKLPDHNGVVFRGTDLPPNVLAKYEKGTVVTEDAFTSTSASADEAFPGDTQFTILSKYGKDVSLHSDVPSEQEVLFPPGTQFDVVSKVFDSKSGTTFIRLIQR
ncbi:ADP-ribosyltransferase domain-containing protein [Nocardia sp. NPDC006630]|uniref:ADP-ribosyltransferase domain-containing protein n=1 Tax=Nocardia sp. NPDC006630 TaxID=3157181 RepID=UPI0033BF91F6